MNLFAWCKHVYLLLYRYFKQYSVRVCVCVCVCVPYRYEYCDLVYAARLTEAPHSAGAPRPQAARRTDTDRRNACTHHQRQPAASGAALLARFAESELHSSLDSCGRQPPCAAVAAEKEGRAGRLEVRAPTQSGRG